MRRSSSASERSTGVALETDWRIAREKLAVGLAVEVALERGVTAEVSIDGQSRQVRIDAGEPAALEAKRELRLDLAGIGVVHVRGGGRDLLREAAAAEERWNGAAEPVLARAGCATLPALEALRARADALLETVSGLERQAEQERARAENLDELERRAVGAKADVEQRRAALAELLDDGESVEEHVNGLDEQPRDETSLEQGIARLEARAREREGLRRPPVRVMLPSCSACSIEKSTPGRVPSSRSSTSTAPRFSRSPWRSSVRSITASSSGWPGQTNAANGCPACETSAFRNQSEQGAVAVEAPWPPVGDDLEPVFVVAVEQLVGDRAGRRLVRQLERLGAEPLHADDRHHAVRVHAPNGARAHRQPVADLGVTDVLLRAATLAPNNKPRLAVVANGRIHY